MLYDFVVFKILLKMYLFLTKIVLILNQREKVLKSSEKQSYKELFFNVALQLASYCGRDGRR